MSHHIPIQNNQHCFAEKYNMSKFEYMLNVNNWMEKSFAQSYQILCEFHYSKHAIKYFVHQGMLSPNNSVVMEEKNCLY